MLARSLAQSCCRRAALAALLAVLAWPAGAATVTGMYDAVVPLSERSERGQAAALQDAMRQVLVRVTGQRDAGQEPALAALINDARRYVQQFRVVGTNQFAAGFDGARIERALIEAGQPLWGRERPATLVLLVGGEAGARTVLTEETGGEMKGAVQQAAQLRGLPLMWPNAARPLAPQDIGDGSPSALEPLAGRFNADAVLLGVSGGAGDATLRWTLVQGGETSQWRGSAAEGPQGAADWFARVYSAQSSDEGSLVAITVSGVSDLKAYAAVTDYLQSLVLVRSLSVDEVVGDNVIFRARVQGSSERLARAIGLGGRLEPDERDGAPGGAGATLAYRYRQ